MGAHRNLRVYGSASQLTLPTVDRSTPSTVIQACRVLLVRNSGIPEENPRTSSAAILRWPKTRRMDRDWCSFKGFLASAGGMWNPEQPPAVRKLDASGRGTEGNREQGIGNSGIGFGG